MKRVVLFLFFWMLLSMAFGQGAISLSISGIILDQDGEPLPYASVALHRTQNEALETGTASDETGKFILNAKPGNYFIKISFLSFKDKKLEGINITDKDLNLGKVKMESNSQSLKELTVAADKADMELKLDKRVVNVSKDINNKGRNAVEILDNIPSVSVGVEGEISLRGSENVRILIDGKPSGLVGVSSSDALRQLQAGMIESVEIITNPSARYDAEGEVGIINIVLKKEQKKNLNGSLDVNAGYPHNHGVALNLNYRREFANIFGSYGLNYQERPGRGKSYQKFNYEDTSFSYNRIREHSRNGLSNSFRVGSEFFLNPSNSFTLAGIYRISEGNNNSFHQYEDYNSADQLTGVVKRNSDEEESIDYKELSFNYFKRFEKKDHTWTFDVKWMDSEDLEKASLTEVADDFITPDINQKTSNTENEVTWFFQTDYVQPFAKEGKFEAGLKANLRNIDNQFSVEEKGDNDIWEVIPDYNNHLLYTENIYAGYLMAGNKSKNFSYQAGLRAEYTSIGIQLLKTNENNPKQYLQFFPSLHLSYKLNEKSDVQLSYSRRISRPRFWWLLPFTGFDDSRNIFSGNPDLNPEYTSAFEAGYLKNWEKGNVLTSLYYRYTTEKIDRIMVSDTSGLTRNFPVNLGVENSFGLEVSGAYRLLEAWNLNGNFDFYRSIMEGSYEERDFSNDTYVWNFRGSSKWTVKKKLGVQASFNYRSPRKDPQGKVYSMYFFDLGASYDLLKGNGTLTLSARDVFNTRKRRYYITGANFVTDGEFQWRSRQIVLTFSYRLNQKKLRGNRNNDFDGGGDE